MDVISTGVKCIDKLMKGGVHIGVPTGLYGMYNIGKTIMSMQIAIKCAMQEQKVLYIDTERHWNQLLLKVFLNWYKDRWNIDPKQIMKFIEIKHITSIHSLIKYLIGGELHFHQKGKKQEAIIFYGRQDRKQPFKEGTQYEDWMEFSGFYKDYHKKKDEYSLGIIDSVTAPIKRIIASGEYNLPARAHILRGVLMGTVDLSQDFNVAFLITNHGVRSPRYEYAAPAPWGGDSMIYFVKRWIGIIHGLKDEKDVYTENVRRIWRYRYPLCKERMVYAILAKDKGFIDPEDLLAKVKA